MQRRVVVGQAGGATAVINSSLVGIVQECRTSGKFAEVWGLRRGVEGAWSDSWVDLLSIPPASLHALARTPGAALGTSRHKLTEQEVESLLDLLCGRGITDFLYIGGNDSADTTHRLACRATLRGQELNAIAVPKTIDNDLPITDHCPGYGSIARFTAIATMDSAKDTESMPTMYPIKVIEVMGRNAGWVAAASTLARREVTDAPHLVYVPERPVSRDQMLMDVERVRRTHGHVVIVVTETMRDERGRPFADPAVSGEMDSFGHPLLRGTADSLCRLIQEHTGLRSRFDKPGSLQRMSMVCASSLDLEEAAQVGKGAVRLVLDGQTDRMVTIVRDSDDPYTWHTASVPLVDIANRQKLMPEAFLTSDGHDTTEAFRRYCLPLLGPEPLPSYTRL